MNHGMRITVYGIVQGVGYRPFVVRLAQRLGLCGSIQNNGGIVSIEAQGTAAALEEFVQRLRTQCPPGGMVTDVLTEEAPLEDVQTFGIRESSDTAAGAPVIPPDLPVCDLCAAELYDRKDRRKGYPFLSCVSCGPRYSIIRRLPYDRENITMDRFAMCADCTEEYQDLASRRCHAQTIACHACGPQLLYETSGGTWEKTAAFDRAVNDLRAGGILAVKDIGGYHFVCRPDDEASARRLRRIKGREKKPFAVMFPDEASAEAYCQISAEERDALQSVPRPIVLLGKKRDFAASVCGESDQIGAFLPAAPLQLMLCRELGPLVMTSANRSGAPIFIDDSEMRSFFQETDGLCGVLYHKREILTPLDDSVVRVLDGKTQVIRRARGYVPMPLLLQERAEQPFFAAGSDLKAAFCLFWENRGYMSQYFGDLEDLDVYRTYQKTVPHMAALHRIWPEKAVCDMHPRYFSAQYAKKQFAHVKPVQHHMAHVASVLAEHRLEEDVIGVSFDGTGYGLDGAVWGGEFFRWQDSAMERVAHLEYVTLCGGDASAKDAVLSKGCYLHHCGLPCEDPAFPMLQAAIKQQINTYRYSGMGRLFDAVAALLGICRENGYEGECAIQLEQAAAAAQGADPPPALYFGTETGYNNLVLTIKPLLEGILAAQAEGISPGVIALGFHQAVVRAVRQVCGALRRKYGIASVALSGGVFMNRILCEGCLKGLREDGFSVYINEKVPTNDGGIALGQGFLALRDPTF